MASGTHKKMKLIGRGKYNLGGAEFGMEYQANFGTFEPDFGTGYEPIAADAGIAADHRRSDRIARVHGPLRRLEQPREARLPGARLKAYMKVQF